MICKTVFTCSPSDRKITCSRECRQERARRAKTAKGRPWSKASRARLSLRRQTSNLKLGMQAALQSPIAGPFETNHKALIWVIVSPAGDLYEIRNLNLWLRTHAHLLPGTPEQARAGLMQIKRSTLGKTKRPVQTWKGWTLLDWREP